MVLALVLLLVLESLQNLGCYPRNSGLSTLLSRVNRFGRNPTL